jgi:hypothetical protein
MPYEISANIFNSFKTFINQAKSLIAPTAQKSANLSAIMAMINVRVFVC